MVLIPKIATDTRGVGLLETLWKVLEAIIDPHLYASLQFHDVLHKFRVVRVTGTDIVDLNLAQELARIYHDPLFLVFLHLRKAYDIIDRDRLIHTLERYGAGPGLCELMENFWSQQKVVPR